MEKQNQDPVAILQAYLDQCAAEGIKPQRPADDYIYWTKDALIARINELELHISDMYNDGKTK